MNDEFASPSSVERQCGRDEVWQEFLNRFRRQILLYVLRAYRATERIEVSLLVDLTQEVDARLRDSVFNGKSEFALKAFVARIAVTVVRDHIGSAGKVVAIDSFKAERRVASEVEQSTARDVLIWQLHTIDGLSGAQVAAFPGFGLSVSQVETVIATQVRKAT